ncbi:MAG: GreA/GreB family elongation factor [Opitutales bacterium]|nr:GreA/GreB family elongation factor [Opitutales bacterium]
MNKEAIDLLIQKQPRLKRVRTKLEALQPGSYVVHRSWGVGCIQDYDAQQNRLIIDFEQGNQGHAMAPEFCVERMEILEENDLLVRYRKEPAPIDEMIKKRPTALIAEILSRFPEKSASNTEIEAVLSRLIGPTKFRKWWNATKKQLVKDPDIAVPGKKTDPYVLREEPVKAEDEILEDFFETKAPKKKINLAGKLIDMSVEHKDIEQALPDILRELTGSLAETKQLNPGERLYGIWVRNDLARFIHADPESLEPTSKSIIVASNDLSQLAEQIPATHYKRYIDLIERSLPDSWDRVVFDLLKNSSGKLTAESINYLLERGYEEDLGNTFKRWLVEQNLKAPVLTWILKNRQSKKYAKMLDGLMTPRLLNAIFFAIDYEALQNAGTRRIPLAELLNDDQELIGDLLATAPAETAHDLAQTLILNQGFEDLSKKSLLARFIKLFPSVQQIVDGDAPTAPSADEGLIVSKPSLAARKREYEELIQQKIPQNKLDIAEARAHGDLRENAEYKMARQEQDILLARKAELEIDINRARTTDFSDAPDSSVGIGTVVELEQGSSGNVVTYAILGAWDGDPEKNIVSYQTPLAKALIGKQPGESVEIEVDSHRDTWKIRSIARWIESPMALA